MEYENKIPKSEKSKTQNNINSGYKSFTPYNQDFEQYNFNSFLTELSQILNNISSTIHNTESDGTVGRRGSRVCDREYLRRKKASSAESVEEERSNIKEGFKRDYETYEREGTEEESAVSDSEFYRERSRKLTSIKNEKYKYLGEIREGMRDGFGICYYTGGEVYTGQWKKDMREGKGKMMLPNGDVQIGELKENKFEGFSEIFNYKIDLEVRGSCVNGKFRGELFCRIGDETIEGINLISFSDEVTCIGVSNIQVCKFRMAIDAYYLGEINIGSNSTMNHPIYGIYVKEKEFMYMGELILLSSSKKHIDRYFLPHGYGEFYYNDLSRYYGFFKFGKKEGLGLHLFTDGRIFFGKFENDIKSGPFFILTKSTSGNSISSMKMEIYHLGFKSKTVEKQDNIKKYLPLNYPEFAQILNFDYKVILNKIWEWDMKDDEEIMKDIFTLDEEEGDKS